MNAETLREKIKKIFEDAYHSSNKEWLEKYGDKKYWDVFMDLFYSQAPHLIEEIEKEKIQAPEGDAKRFAYEPEYYKGFNQGLSKAIEVIKYRSS